MAAISGAFHRCYVIESLRPELKANTPPSVNYNDILPSVYTHTELSWEYIEGVGTVLRPEYLEFSIPKIFDPDSESELSGRYAIDYDGSGAALGGNVIVTLKQGENHQWEGSFKLETSNFFSEVGTYEVTAALSDKGWDETSENFFAVPEQTEAAFIRWTVHTPTR